MTPTAHPRGKYIVLEGIDGCGKTTQRDLLLARLEKAGVHARVVREPAGDAVGRAIRKILLDPQYEINAKSEVLLFNAARAGLMDQINRILDMGLWAIADRNFLSTIAYQGYGREEGLNVDEIRAICDFTVAGTDIDLGLILDGPPEAFAARKASRATGDRLDSLGDAFYTRARTGYLHEARQRDFPVLDATGSIDDVHELIWARVSPLLVS